MKKTSLSQYALLQIVILLATLLGNINAITTGINGTKSNHTDTSHKESSSHGAGIHIFQASIKHVQAPFGATVWVLLASIAKIVFHHFEKLSSTIPESCLLILLGIPIGFILEGANISGEDTILTYDLFFFYLLPPIILDAGYFMPTQTFYCNIGTILLYAVFGTIFNAFAVGLALWGIAGFADFKITLLQSLLFGSLISAVDPVAVLAVFEEVHVHEILYMLVFGESVLNDAASVVLYRTFETLITGTVNAEQIGLAFVSFFVVSLGGCIVGVICAFLTSFITKYTEHVRVIEPVFIFLMSYMSYLVAEIFHFSGIISILVCAIIMKPYVESNMSRKSHTTVKYFLKLLSSSADSIIFMFLGVSLVQYNLKFNWIFIVFTLLFISIFRAVGVTVLTAIANKFGRLEKVKKVEQFIMSYGGLRGAVAFCLAILINNEDDSAESQEFKRTIVTTTIVVVMFTTFIQGTTIKKLVDLLGVRRSDKRCKTMAETLNDRMQGYMVAGIEEIIGVHGHGFWSDLLEHFNKKILRRLLERDPDNPMDDNLLLHQRKMAFRDVLEYANNPLEIMAREEDGKTLSQIKSNPSVAMHLALKAQDEFCTTEYCGILDINALSNRSASIDLSMESEAFNPRRISSLIPKAQRQHKRTFSQRKYSLRSLDEEDHEDSHLRRRSQTRPPPHAPMASRPLGRPRHHHHQHRHHHKKKGDNKHRRYSKGRSKPTNMETLPEVDVNDMVILDRNASTTHLADNDAIDKPPDYNGNSNDDHVFDVNDDTETESESESGIVLHFGEKVKHEPQHFVPKLPSFDSPQLSRYNNEPVVDFKEPKEFTEKDQEELKEAKKWRSYTIDSLGADEVISNDAVVDMPDILIDPETSREETQF